LSLPTGIVTFLFTDVEGSSRQWEERPIAMSDLLAHHDGIIRSVVADHGGHVFSTAGDSFAAAFASAVDAVASAVDAQLRLATQLSGIRVRMGLHTGTAEQRGGDYFGPVLNRGARLRDAGWGGQILLTRATYERVADMQGPSVAFEDLGEHRLRDLSDPEHVYQARAVAMPREFPPIRSLGTYVHNLPTQMTPFVGRTREIEIIAELLDETRHATLLGPGGSGKTRLALQVAVGCVDRYPDGVWLVDLRNLTQPVEVASLVAATLRVAMGGERSTSEQLVDALWFRRLLVVLDNCEHVLAGVSPLVEGLLRRDGQVRLLATSRQRLGLSGESVVPVEPFTVPESGDVDEALACDAAQLFSDRARRARPGFAPAEHAESIIEICRACDGLPLALELAATRIRSVSPEEVAGRLDDQLRVLRSSHMVGDRRHATMESTIRWSWVRLEDEEQALLARASVFRGMWTLDAAERVCGFEPIERDDVLDLVGSLVDTSLVVVDGTGEQTRYRLLAPILQFANQQLDDETKDELQHRRLDYWITRLQPSIGAPFVHQHRIQWERASTLEVDRADLTAAVEWALTSGRYEDAMAIFASAFGDLLMLQGSTSELATDWVAAALEHREQIRPEVLLAALNVATGIAATSVRYDECLSYAQLGVELARTREEQHYFSLSAAVWTGRLGREEEADAMFDDVFLHATDPGLRASALLGKARFGAPGEAWELVQRALELSPLDSLGFWDEPVAVFFVGEAAHEVGRYDVAAEMAQRNLELSRRYAWRAMECQAAADLASVYIEQGHIGEASMLVGATLPIARRLLGPNVFKSILLHRAADLSRLRGEIDTARQYVDELRTAAEEDIGMRILATRQEALIARDGHDLRRARELLDAVAGSARGAGIAWSVVHTARASVELRAGDPDRALEHLQEVLAEPEQCIHRGVLEAVELAAFAFAQQEKTRHAVMLLGAAERARDETGTVVPPPDRPLRDAAIFRTQTALGSDWDTRLAEGRAMSLHEAAAYALGHVRD